MSVLNLDQETDDDIVIEVDYTFTDDDVIDELDETLLKEDSEIDIGDMI
jgi:hypothetical protein